jgi:hypothetical protein
MPRLRVVLSAATIALVPLPLQADEQALPGPTERIVRLAGEAGRLRHAIDNALASPTTEQAANAAPSELDHFQTQSGPQPLSWFSRASWKFYGGLILITLAAIALAWAF